MSDFLPDLGTGEGSHLLEMLNNAGARRVLREPSPDLGLAEHLPFPFLAIVGQLEMRTALLLAVINPAVGGVLLIGPRGTSKTTAARSLTDLLPYVEVSTCPACLRNWTPTVTRMYVPTAAASWKPGNRLRAGRR